MRKFRFPLIFVLFFLFSMPFAQAQLFGDDEARQAIIKLRERFDEAVHAQNQLVDDNTNLRRNLRDLQEQIDSLKSQVAELRGQDERRARDIEKLQETQDSLLDSRSASSAQGEFDAALDLFRTGDYKQARDAFEQFVKQHSSGPLSADGVYWLGNSQYATGDYGKAIASYRSLIAASPDHPKAAEALLAVANSQLELGQDNDARVTLEQVSDLYPDSEAAQIARERLNR